MITGGIRFVGLADAREYSERTHLERHIAERRPNRVELLRTTTHIHDVTVRRIAVTGRHDAQPLVVKGGGRPPEDRGEEVHQLRGVNDVEEVGAHTALIPADPGPVPVPREGHRATAKHRVVQIGSWLEDGVRWVVVAALQVLE